MRQRGLSLEYTGYAVVFLLALSIRLAGIAQQPLADGEASLALQALALSRGEAIQISPQPAYLMLTTAWMFLFGGGDWVARFWPALAGSLLVLVPLLYRNFLGRFPALLMAVFLALDPGLLNASLQAGGLTLALFLTLLAAGLVLAGKVAPAGIAAGLALLSGPSVWPGLLGLALSVWLIFLRRDSPSSDLRQAAGGPFAWRRWMIFALVTIFFAGTLFFTIPQGLSAMAASLPAYLSGWVEPSGISIVLIILALILYEFFPLILGLWGGAGGWLRKDPADRFLLVWWVISFGIVLLYPGRQVIDLAWPVVALAGLSARQLTRVMTVPDEDRVLLLGQALLSALILGFLSLTILSVVNNPQFAGGQEYWIRLVGALVMLAASTGLIGWGWSRGVAARGSIWGFFAILFLYAITAAWNSAGLSSKSGREFWTAGRQLPEERLLLETIQDLSEWGPVVSGGPDLVVVGVQSPALRWALRDHPKTEYVAHLSTDSSPALVITVEQPGLGLAATYRGQDFILNEVPDWKSFQSDQWVRWLAFRAVPENLIRRDWVVLWARTDLFPGGEVQYLTDSSDIIVEPVAPE